jgi:NADH dehydrogenase
MRVGLYGGTGFVGSYLVDHLLAAGHEVSLLVRPGSESKVPGAGACRVVPGDVDDPRAVAATLEGCGAAIYNIGLLREFPSRGITFEAMHFEGARRSIDAAREAGVARFLLMSANGVKPDGTAYQRTKFRADQYLEASGLDYTIFRPSVLFGDPRGRMEFCTQLRDEMILPPLPAPAFHAGWLPGGPPFRMSPIHVVDVAESFVRALENPATFGRTCVLCGPEAVEWPEIIRRIAAACGRRKLILPVPVPLLKLVAALLDRFEFFPVTRDQLTMLVEGNTGDSTAVFELLGITPQAFDAAHLAYLASR